MMENIQNKVVLSRIRASFPNEPTFTGKIVLGGSGEELEIEAQFYNRSWWTLSTAELIKHESAIFFLSADPFRYFLPAFMTAVLSDSLAMESLIHSLVRKLTLPTEVDLVRVMHYTGSSSPDIRTFLLEELKDTNERVHRFISYMSPLTKVEGECVSLFLSFLRDDYSKYFSNNEADIAWRRYWFQFSA